MNDAFSNTTASKCPCFLAMETIVPKPSMSGSVLKPLCNMASLHGLGRIPVHTLKKDQIFVLKNDEDS